MTSLPDAVLFDCDGTLLDSETVTTRAMRDVLASMGHELTDGDLARMVGHPWPHTRDLFRELYGMDDAAIEEYRRRMRSGDTLVFDTSLVFDDVVAVLDELQAAGVPLAVVTSSGRDHLDHVLGLAPLRDRFLVRVAREDVARHKPDPLPYTTALAALRDATGRPIPSATVVEDSRAGVEAGIAADCFTVAVDRGADLHDLDHADRVVRRLTTADLVP